MAAKKATKKSVKKTAKKSVKKSRKAAKKSSKKQSPPRRTRANKDESRNANAALFIGVIIVALALVGLAYGPQLLGDNDVVDDLSMYNGYAFAQDEDGLWYVNIFVNDQPVSVVMHYHPTEVDLIPVDARAVALVGNFSTRAIVGDDVQAYISMSPDDPSDIAMAGVEIAKVIGERFDIFRIPTQATFTKATPGNARLVVNCNDADEDTLVFWIKTNGTNVVAPMKQDSHCIVLQGETPQDTVMVADRFVYALFGVIPAN